MERVSSAARVVARSAKSVKLGRKIARLKHAQTRRAQLKPARPARSPHRYVSLFAATRLVTALIGSPPSARIDARASRHWRRAVRARG